MATTESAAPFRLGHRPALDGIRGIAILSVMLFHLYLPMNASFIWFGGGFLGVDIFFVLSGFLITTLLVSEWQRTGHIDLRQFYWRRVLRLAPALVTLLTVLVVVTGLGALVNQTARDQFYILLRAVPATLFYVSNWVHVFSWFDLGAVDMTWSLAVEEQFYLIWPLLLLLALRRGVRNDRLLLLVATGIGWSAISRAVMFHDGVNRFRLYFGSDTRADSILIGCAAGLIVTGGWLPTIERRRTLLSVATACGVVVMAFAVVFVPTPWSASGYLYEGGFTVIALAAALLIVYIVIVPSGTVSSVLSVRPLTGTGKLSYGLYLWHVPVFWAMRKFIAPWWFGADHVDRYGLNAPSRAAAVVLAVSAAAASYYLVEARFLRRRNRPRTVSERPALAHAPTTAVIVGSD